MENKTLSDLKPGDKVIRDCYVTGGKSTRSIVTVESVTKTRIRTKGGESFNIRNGKKTPKVPGSYYNPSIEPATPESIAAIQEANRIGRICYHLQNTITWSNFDAATLDKVKKVLEDTGYVFLK